MDPEMEMEIAEETMDNPEEAMEVPMETTEVGMEVPEEKLEEKIEEKIEKEIHKQTAPPVKAKKTWSRKRIAIDADCPIDKKTMRDKIQEARAAQLQEELDKYKKKREEELLAEEKRKELLANLAEGKVEDQEFKQRKGRATKAPIPTEMSTDPAIARLQCKKCFACFKSKDKLRRHKRSHQQNAEVECNLCGAQIKYRYNLRQHLEKCVQKQVLQDELPLLEANYPDFVAKMNAAMEDPGLDLPPIPSCFKMDKHGFVTGWDPNLKVDLAAVIPNYNKNYKPRIVMEDSSDSEDE
ncbi:Protein CBG21569 [Caenorhabditis briggsae]|uniref:Protein CBG21569 n=2 Tax=Caenorhabditis briggsae TaxID=6238 RepID=A8Y0E3_CAEBR|nr:Protein CBG21569 [Caenorhabditis briggsae]CAP38328.1 Protein CBG21569 [Caenorhabditis briggsae]